MLSKLMRFTRTAQAALVAAGLYAVPANAQEPVKIGFAGPMTGPVSAFGNEIKRGIDMAINAVNAQGGVKGRKFEVVVRDDEFDPVKTVAAYRDLVERQKVLAMVGTANSAAMLAVTPLINDQFHVPTICVHTDATAIIENAAKAEGRDNYLFRLGMFGNGQADFLIDSMVKKFGHKKIALLTWTAGYGQIGRKELTRRLTELGMKPVADETFETGDTDMTAQLLKIKASGADVIFHYGTIREAVSIFQTRKKLGEPMVPFVSSWGIAVPALWKAAGSLAEGTINSNVVTVDGPQSPERQALIAEYYKRYNQEFDDPASFFDAYDAVILLSIAMDKVGFDPRAVRTALENIPSFKGVSLSVDHPVFTRDRHEGHTVDDMMLGRWTDGKFLEIRYDAGGPYITPVAGQKKYIDPVTFGLR
jgi:branched-chain amino acid transport system substrate-binding protein